MAASAHAELSGQGTTANPWRGPRPHVLNRPIPIRREPAAPGRVRVRAAPLFAAQAGRRLFTRPLIHAILYDKNYHRALWAAGGNGWCAVRILGIDPGYAILGYGVIDAAGTRTAAVDYGVIETKAGEPFPERLERLYAGVRQLIGQYRPDAAAFEELFFYRNTTTAFAVGAGRGVALLAAQQSGLPLYEYTPMQIKLAVTGDGHADKHAVQQMVRVLLSLPRVPKPDDAADALACALCRAGTSGPAAEEYRIR